MKTTREAAAESGKFHDVTTLIVTLTCPKSILWVRGILPRAEVPRDLDICSQRTSSLLGVWVRGTASKQRLCSLLHRTGEVFVECVSTDQKDIDFLSF